MTDLEMFDAWNNRQRGSLEFVGERDVFLAGVAADRSACADIADSLLIDFAAQNWRDAEYAVKRVAEAIRKRGTL